MAKTSTQEDREEKLRRKLAKAQADLERAQEQRAAARTQGEEEVEDARRRAAARLAKATERLERRAAKITRIEAQLQALAPHTTRPPGSRHGEGGQHGADYSEQRPQSPAAAADALQTIQGDEPVARIDLVVPDGPGAISPSELAGQHAEELPQP